MGYDCVNKKCKEESSGYLWENLDECKTNKERPNGGTNECYDPNWNDGGGGDDGGGGNKGGVMVILKKVGIAVGIILVVLIVLAIIIAVILRYRAKKKN